MFASKRIETHPLPSDPAVLVTIHALSWLQREDAQTKAQRASSRGLIEMGGAAFMKEWRQLTAEEKATDDDAATKALEKVQAAAVEADPLASHDMLTVLVCGVVSWVRNSDEPQPPAPSKDTLSDLDPEDAEFLARKILALTLRPKRTEEQEKNVVSGSTGI